MSHLARPASFRNSTPDPSCYHGNGKEQSLWPGASQICLLHEGSVFSASYYLHYVGEHPQDMDEHSDRGAI